MLQKAQGDDERLNACNTLWTLAFDEDNKKEIKGNESAIPELQKLLSSNNSELRKAAAGALWECQGKEKHAEKKQLSVTVPEAAGTNRVWVSFFENLKWTMPSFPKIFFFFFFFFLPHRWRQEVNTTLQDSYLFLNTVL